jgi:hypothetical protein
MGTQIKVLFTNDSATPSDWKTFIEAMFKENYKATHNGGENTAEYLIYGSYTFCGEFPNVDGVPKIKGITWQKWYEEREPDEEGTLQE